MKTRTTLFFAIALGLFAVSACKKKTTETPKPTGVVLCKVNGTAWESGSAMKAINIDGNYYYMTGATLQGDTLTIGAIRKDTDTSGIYFNAIPLKAGAVGTVNGTTNAYSGALYMTRWDYVNGFVTALGKYNITYELSISKKDATNKTISGTFLINMTSGSGNIKVSEGEFIDLKYK